MELIMKRRNPRKLKKLTVWDMVRARIGERFGV